MPTGDTYSFGHLNLSLLFRTMLFEYPSLLSRFCIKRFITFICGQLSARNTEQARWQKEIVFFVVGFEPLNGTISSLRVLRLNHTAISWLLWMRKWDVYALFYIHVQEKKKEIWPCLMTTLPYTNRKIENQKITHKRHQKRRLHNDCGPT